MIRRALTYFRPSLTRIGLSTALMLAMTFLGLLPPLLLALLIDLFAATTPAERDTWLERGWAALRPESVPAQILLITLLTLALRLAKELLQMTQTLLHIRIGYDALMALRCDVFRKLQELSVGYHRSQPQGDAIYRLQWDTFGIQSLYNVLFGSLGHVVTLAMMLAVMLSFDWRMTLLSLAVIPPLLAIIRGYGKLMQRYTEAAKAADAKLTSSIQRAVAAVSLVQAFNRQLDEQERFTTTVHSSVSAWMALHRREVLYWLLLGLVFTLASTAFLGIGGMLVYRGELSVGVLTAFLGYLQGFYDPLNRLSASGSAWQSAKAGVKRVFEVLDRDVTVADPPQPVPLPLRPRRLEFRGVTFAYPGPDGTPGEAVLSDISAVIPPGQFVAFVGSSGVGKTTLLSLLPRFYDPTAGAILLDDIDIRHVCLAELRAHVALVLQDNLVLPTTIAENIAYGRPTASEAELREAARLAGALEFIEKLPRGFQTDVAEGGANLSGGQRQRLGIARALLTRAPILVLDEPTSALDPQTEQYITRTLESLRGQRTLIVVSHRLSTVLSADQIFVLRAGRIVEAGTHAQLVARGGLYFEMARHQLQLPDPAPPLHTST
ncbi:MAG: ABC transporter ATP-binding protein [Tepidisphaerales bacterium]